MLIRLLGVVALCSAGCITRSPFVCDIDTQCDVGGAVGFCEATGYCSVADASCESGRRYASEAPSGLAGECVGAGGGPDAGGDAASDAGADGAADASADATEEVSYDPSNFEEALLTAGTGTLRVRAADGVVEIDSDQGWVTRTSDGADLRPAGAAFQIGGQGAGMPMLGVLSVAALEIEAGAQVRVVGEAALALAVAGQARIDGTIDARGGRTSVFTPGAGGFAGGRSGAPLGLGPCGGQVVEAIGDVGGGGGGHGASGGTGGARGASAGGQAGGVCGDAALVPLVGGSGGSAGGGGATRGVGGGGGGALQISARGEVAVGASGVINVGGGGGGGGGNDDGGGGGGAGGAVLLEGARVRVDGALVANGGGGGAGANVGTPGAAGQPGGSGSLRAVGGPRAGEGGAGGAGGAGVNAAGDNGETVPGIATNDNAGGGGGGGGRVRLRGGEIIKSGVISPAALLSEAPL